MSINNHFYKIFSLMKHPYKFFHILNNLLMLQTKYSLKYVLDIFSPRLPFTNVVIATYNECMFLAMNFGAVF